MGIANNFRRMILQCQRVFLDSSPLIYHLEDIEPYSMLTTEVFMALANGTLEGVISTVSVTELLTKPYREGKDDLVNAFEEFILSLPQTRMIVPSYTITKRAAWLRGRYNLRTPDALLFSTAQEEGCDAFITNDSRLKKLKLEGITVVILSDYTKR